MNDLIGRQAAIDAFDGVVKVRSLKNAETVMDYIREVVKRIHDLPPAWAGQTWIPCHKRLPGDGEEVFVYLYDSPYIAWVKDGHWYTEEFEVEKENEPMAWMPLPTLYKEDKGDS